jgi:hypothetical protein
MIQNATTPPTEYRRESPEPQVSHYSGRMRTIDDSDNDSLVLVEDGERRMPLDAASLATH